MPLQIKTVLNSDVQRLIDLWLSCFTDDEADYPREFLQFVDLSTDACVGFVNGKPVTMLFLLPATARSGKITQCVRYLYAGCTHPDYRRRGYYEELLAYAVAKVKEWGEEAIYLYPAEKSLFAYYERLGYRAGITCAPYDEDSFWWEPDEPFRSFFFAAQGECETRGECLWIPAREDSNIVEIMKKNHARTRLVGN